MNTVDTDHLEDAHLAQWLKTSHHYLLGDQKKIVNVTEKALLDAKLDSHGAQDRFLSRARGSLLRLVKCSAQHDQNPLQELERAFYFQVTFIAQHPEFQSAFWGGYRKTAIPAFADGSRESLINMNHVFVE